MRCPNIPEVQKRAQEIRDAHSICKYNMHECSCFAWLAKVNTHKFSGRCTLSGSNDCPMYKRQKENGKKEKTFRIDNKTYRKISSGAHLMVKASKHKTLFVTLTFPKFKRKHNEKEINQCFSKFMENLHNNYGVKNYIAVKEYGEDNGRAHFHLLLSIKFTDFNLLNSAWCAAISNISEPSRNAFTTRKDHIIIRSPGRALRYACKYFSKSRGTVSKSRLVFISNNLLSHVEEIHTADRDGVIIKTEKKRVSNIKITSSGCVEDILKGYKGIYIKQTSDYSTCFRITNPVEFDRFCKLYLYELFDLNKNKYNSPGLVHCKT